jgi:hypothetical protein
MAHGNFDKENFDRFVSEHARKAGMDEQAFDSDAYYDSSLTYQENKENFKAAFPTPSEHSATGKELRGARVQEWKYNAEMKKAERQEKRDELRKLATEEMEKNPVARQSYPELDESDLTEGGSKPGIIETLKGKIGGAQKAYGEWNEKRMKEREFKAKRGLEQRKHEAEIKNMERAYRPQGGSNPLAMLHQNNQGSAMGKLLAGTGGNQTSGIAALALRGSSQQSGFAAMGGHNQSHPRGKYVTVVDKGKAYRVRVGGEQEQAQQMGHPQQSMSPFMQSIFSGNIGHKGGLAGLSVGGGPNGLSRGRGQKRSALSGFQTSGRFKFTAPRLKFQTRRR